MGCRDQFCVGGGCTPDDVSAQDFVEAFGYTYNPADPLSQTYKDLLATLPSGLRSSYPGWVAMAEACMRTRALLFCNKTPGDAGTTQQSSANSNLLGQGVGVATTVATTVANSLGIATFGLSSLVAPLLSLFQAHAKAEAAQANALNNLTPLFTEYVRKIDSAFFAGQLDASDAANAIAQAAISFKSSVASLYKSCNAFCGYDAIAGLIASISPQFYQLYADQTSSAESANSGAIISNGSSTSGLLAQTNETGLASVAGLTLPFSLTGNSLLIGIIAIGAVVLFSRNKARG